MLSRWLVLFIVCIGMFGYNYCYDNPVALQNQLHSHYGVDNVKYALLYSIYAFPNAMLPFFSGVLTDILGVNTMALICFAFILFGHCLFTIACMLSKNNFVVMLIGRLLFGIGSESYSLTVTLLLYQYFKHKELAFSLGLLLSFSRVGSSTNDYLTYYIYKTTNSVTAAVSFGFWILMICFVLLLVLIAYRVYFEKKVTASSSKQHSESLHASLSSFSHHPDSETIEILDAKIYNNCKSRDSMSSSLSSILDSDGFQLKDIKEFDSCYWLLTFNCGILYGGFYPFMNIASDFLQHTFDLSNSNANVLLMVPYITSSVATMFFGYISDKIGKRGYMLLFASLLLVLSHSIFIACILNQHNDIYFVMIAFGSLGIEFSIFCAVIWPSFAFIVDERCLGTAYGFPMSLYNLIVAVFYIVVGSLTDTDGHYANDGIRDKYLNVEYFLLGVSIFSVFSVWLLLYMDSKTGNRLNIPSIARSNND